MKIDKERLFKYRFRLLLTAFLVISYSSYISWSAISERNKSIKFSQLEITGAKLLPSIKELLIHTQKLRELTVAYRFEDTVLLPRVEQQRIVVKAKLQDVQQAVINANLRNITPLFDTLSSKLQQALNNTASQTPQNIFKTYSYLIQKEIALIVKVGDMSNLILDPDLDTFYLMDLVINKLPLLTESISKAKGIVSIASTTNILDQTTTAELTVLLGSLKNNISLVQNGLDSAYVYNHALMPRIYPYFEKLVIDTNKFTDCMTQLIEDQHTKDLKKFFQSGSVVMDDTLILYDISNKNLLKLLTIRVEKMKIDRDNVIIAGIIFFFILLTLFYIAYDYLYKNLLIREASDKEKKLLQEIQNTNDSLKHSLSHDKLTGLYNRSSLMEILSKQHNNVIMLIDINAFKEVNDIYGNSFGNKILKQFAKFLERFFKEMDDVTIYRIGGDEFAILFTHKTLNEIMQIGKNLEEDIKEAHFEVDEIEINISVNISINNIPPLLENADLALKFIKKDMSKSFIEYREELSIKKEWQKNIEVINMVKSALKEGRIIPYFQGIVNLQTLKIEKYEALVRLLLPSGEVLPPYAFLDVISKTHYYYEISEVMIKKTIEVAKIYPELRFSINLSMKDITNTQIIKSLFELFDADKETAKRIDIELLETELITVNDNCINNFIKKVHSYGSKILLDDFGTGYSNFAYLSDLDVDILKIDGSIIKEINTNPRQLHILQTIRNFTSGMGMLNVAEFVETKEIALLLQETGIEYAQGYLFSKPLPKPLKNNKVTMLPWK